MMNEETILHRFPVEVAEDIGVNAAIIFFDICYWCGHNEITGENFFGDRNWMYSSPEDFTKRHQYFTAASVRNSIDKLVKSGWIIKLKNPQKNFTTTCYYAPTDGVWIGMLKFSNENAKNSIPMKNNINNITSSSNYALTREEFEHELKTSQMKRQNAMKVTGVVTEEEFDFMCEIILTEWETTGAREWSWQHLVNHMRIKKEIDERKKKDANSRRNNGNAKKSTRAERDEEFRAHILSKIQGACSG